MLLEQVLLFQHYYKTEPIEFLNDLKFDVGTIGNHEFDEGVEEMNRLIYGGYHEKTGNFKGAKFPYVAANFYNKSTGRLFYHHSL